MANSVVTIDGNVAINSGDEFPQQVFCFHLGIFDYHLVFFYVPLKVCQVIAKNLEAGFTFFGLSDVDPTSLFEFEKLLIEVI